MKIYNSFLIRCWLLRDTAQADRSIFEIEHIQTGERRRAASLAEVERWMLSALPPADRATQVTSRTEASDETGNS